MINFEFSNTTEIIFGRDTQKQVGERIRKYSDCTRVLLAYGSSRIKGDSLFDTVRGSLEEQGIGVLELGGVKPNSRLGLIRQGVDICRRENISFILAVGGGSAVDTAKAIGVGIPYEGDVWDFYLGKKVSEKTLKTATVCTIPAAGNEASLSSVLTNEDGWCKKSINLDPIRPVFSVINSKLTFILPAYQVGCGVMGMMAHIMERYFTNTTHVDPTDRLYGAALRSIIVNGVRTLKGPYSYNAKAEIVWTDTLAHSGLLNTGRVQDRASYKVTLEVSGKYGIAHGASLSVVYPAQIECVYNHDKKHFMQFTVRVQDAGLVYGEESAICLEGVRKMREFFKQLGVPITFKDAELPTDAFGEMAGKTTYGDTVPVGNFVKIGRPQMVDVYRLCTKKGAL